MLLFRDLTALLTADVSASTRTAWSANGGVVVELSDFISGAQKPKFLFGTARGAANGALWRAVTNGGDAQRNVRIFRAAWIDASVRANKQLNPNGYLIKPTPSWRRSEKLSARIKRKQSRSSSAGCAKRQRTAPREEEAEDFGDDDAHEEEAAVAAAARSSPLPEAQAVADTSGQMKPQAKAVRAPSRRSSGRGALPPQNGLPEYERFQMIMEQSTAAATAVMQQSTAAAANGSAVESESEEESAEGSSDEFSDAHLNRVARKEKAEAAVKDARSEDGGEVAGEDKAVEESVAAPSHAPPLNSIADQVLLAEASATHTRSPLRVRAPARAVATDLAANGEPSAASDYGVRTDGLLAVRGRLLPAVAFRSPPACVGVCGARESAPSPPPSSPPPSSLVTPNATSSSCTS